MYKRYGLIVAVFFLNHVTVYASNMAKPSVHFSKSVGSNKTGNRTEITMVCIDGYKYVLNEGYNKSNKLVSSQLTQMYFRSAKDQTLAMRCQK